MDDNEKISLGGANGNKPPQNNIPIDNEFQVPSESVLLPSKGAFYPNGKNSVIISYMTSESDNILFSTDLIKSGKVLDVLLENQILDKDLRPDDMISGDRNFLLIEIRKTGFGAEYYPGIITCGSCGQDDKPVADLNKLKPKMLEVMPDEIGEYPLMLPVTKMNIKFRLLRGSDEKRLSKLIESGQKKSGGYKVSRLITERYLLQIMDVNGNRDKIYISKFINIMPTKDSLFFRQYNKEIEPGINLNYEFECPYCNHVEEKNIPINSALFYPDLD